MSVHTTQSGLPTEVFDWGAIKWGVTPGQFAGVPVTVGEVVIEPTKGHDLHTHPESDEVLVVLEGDRATGVEVRARVETSLADPMTVGGVETSGRASIGIAVAAPCALVDGETLLDLADADMYGAKRSRPAPLEPATAPAAPLLLDR